MICVKNFGKTIIYRIALKIKKKFKNKKRKKFINKKWNKENKKLNILINSTKIKNKKLSL